MKRLIYTLLLCTLFISCSDPQNNDLAGLWSNIDKEAEITNIHFGVDMQYVETRQYNGETEIVNYTYTTDENNNILLTFKGSTSQTQRPNRTVKYKIEDNILTFGNDRFRR